MSLDYKIVFRADAASEGAHALTWEPGCPLAFEAVQIARHVETGAAYLQAKVKNVSGRKVARFEARFQVAYHGGELGEVVVRELDADIAAGVSRAIAAQRLTDGDVAWAEGAIVSAEGDGVSWASAGEALPFPERAPIELSEVALSERRAQFAERFRRMPAKAADFALREEAAWWQCPCCQVNVGTDVCCACGASLGALRELEGEDEESLEAAASEREQRRQEEARRKEALNRKRKKIAKRVAAVAIPLVVVVAVAGYFAMQAARNASLEQVYEAKYTYVQENFDRGDSRTCAYLEEMAAAGYKDSEELYAKLYSAPEVFMKFTSDRGRSGYVEDVSLGYRFVGGEPDQEVTISYEVYGIEDVSGDSAELITDGSFTTTVQEYEDSASAYCQHLITDDDGDSTFGPPYSRIRVEAIATADGIKLGAGGQTFVLD